MTDRRPDPDSLLLRAKAEEVQHRGQLKIYLGAAPGVGKTYTMLQDARSRRSQGLDVVAGVVETHGRIEIEDLLKPLEVLPRLLVEYHGSPLLEFDLDAALARNPGLILIDEMAHHNVPGLRHAKRWQDIKELLDRGIDVYTTLNVQHIESLNDVINQIIGITVRETVPDLMVELATTVELVDLPPEDLLIRLQEGKIYIPAQAELATQHFFRKSNLTALRELALRYTAKHVDEEVLLQRRGQGVVQTWPTTERLLVCIGSGLASARVIRAACRMAASLHAEWIVVHVDAPRLQLSQEQRKIAIQNLRLAEQLGAETRILSGLDVAQEIIDFAQDRNVTKIVMGKHTRPRWKEFLFGSLVDDLVRHSGEIDIYIIRGDVSDARVSKPKSTGRSIPWGVYGLALGVIALATGINFLLYTGVGLGNLMMVYLLGVAAVATRGYAGPAILVSVLSVCVLTFFFIKPEFGFSVSDIKYFLMMSMMLLIALVISYFMITSRQQAEIARSSERRIGALHVLARQLASTRGFNQLLDIAVRYISKVFNSEVLALILEDNKLIVQSASASIQKLNEKEEGVAQWVYDLGQVAGLGTDTLPFSDSIYVPLLGSSGSIGVLKIHPKQAENLLIPEQLRLLEACANQIALALEVDRLEEKAKESQIAIETERLRTALFSSLSHELRQPLSVIVRMINRFVKQKSEFSEQATREFIQEVAHEAERLNRLIDNLLQITQLEEGKIKLNKKPHSLEKMINATLSRLEKKIRDKPYQIQLTSNLPLVPFDKVLMEQVLVNLIENAILYTPPESPIEISASLEEDDVLLSVADHGPGLMLADVEKVFEKFYRGEQSKKESGSGLGLSVCQSIIKAHGGKIWAENRWGGGAIFYFVLPLKEESPHH